MFHNDISYFIIDNLIKEEDLQNNIENNYYDNLYRYSVKSHKYCFPPSKHEIQKNVSLFK